MFSLRNKLIDLQEFYGARERARRLIYNKSRHTVYFQNSDKFIKKKSYNSIIPLNIFQTWDNKNNLPYNMRRAINNIKKNNPEFKYELYTDNECLKFIKDNFDESVSNAYQKLIPKAFRADLWRYCILYKKGGIYMDIKYIPNNNFSFMDLTESEHFCLDADNIKIYNAFMVSLPNNPALLNAINKIVENVNTKNYGTNYLDVTGPGLLALFIKPNDKVVDMKHKVYNNNQNNRVVIYRGKHILKCYPNYAQEQKKTGGTHYSILWNNKQVFYK